jgi:hypothetical protein
MTTRQFCPVVLPEWATNFGSWNLIQFRQRSEADETFGRETVFLMDVMFAECLQHFQDSGPHRSDAMGESMTVRGIVKPSSSALMSAIHL